MNLRKVRLVAVREYLSNVKTKGFWIGVLIMPVIFVASVAIPIWIEKSKDTKVYGVLDETGWLAQEVDARIQAEDLERLFTRYEKATKKTAYPQEMDALNAYYKALEGDAKQLFLTGLAYPDRSSGTLLSALSTEVGAFSQWWHSDASKKIRDKLPGSNSRRYRVEIYKGDEGVVDRLNKALEEEELYAYFTLKGEPVKDGGECLYVTTNLANEDLKDFYGSYVDEIVRDKRLKEKQISEDVASWVSESVPFASRLLSDSGEAREAGEEDMLKQWAPVAFVYLLWLCVFMISMTMLTSTVTEKSNRLMEVLLSSVSAIELMVGKVVGTAATGLTTVGIWLVSFIGAAVFLPAIIGETPEVSLSAIASDPVFLISFVVYFTLGYLFYGAILVGLGSICDNLKDAQNLATPVTLTLFIPMMLMIPIAEDPNGTLARIASYIPPLTPFAMMNRASGPPPMIDYVLTTLIMVASVTFALWAAAKIFRVGVLLTGKPPKIKELIHWLRQPM